MRAGSGSTPREDPAESPGTPGRPVPQPLSPPSPPFDDVVCAVDDSRGSSEAAHQAIALAGSETSLTFVSVCNETGYGLSAQADLSEDRARRCLDECVSMARRAGVDADASLLWGAPVSDVLLAESLRHDLLLSGCHGGSRLGGIMLGSIATQLAHRTEAPLMVARRTADGHDFPRSMLLATDGSPASWAAALAATGLAKARGSEVRVIHVPDGMHPERRREVEKQVSVIAEGTGAPPPVVGDPGHVAERICATAQAGQASLLVIGRRGVGGMKALGSVSERVVHRAQCSVMLVPQGTVHSAMEGG